MSVKLESDPDVVIMGEDVGYFGGVFRATAGLQEKFGKTRVFDTPISECGIIGAAVGMGAYGLRPVPEIQFADYIYPGLDQLISEAARLRYRSAAEFIAPMTVRSPFGGGIFGGQTHSQSPESIFTHVAGLKTVIPATPYDAKGLLIAAIEDNDPVIFFEPKRIYNGPFSGYYDKPAEPWKRFDASIVPEGHYSIPLGKARIVTSGEALTILAYGTMVHVVKAVCEAKGIEADILDLRTLLPLDIEAIEAVGQAHGPLPDRARGDAHFRLRGGAVRAGDGTLFLSSRSAGFARDRLRYALSPQPRMGLFPRPGAHRRSARHDSPGLIRP